jgi:hypothetical protein
MKMETQKVSNAVLVSTYVQESIVLVRMGMRIMWIAVLSVIALLFGAVSAISYSKGGARKRFEEKLEVCKRYPFYNTYLNSITKPSGRYIIYVFHDQALGSQGGLGDRLGGMVSAMAYAMRTNRTLLIHADKSFEDAFQPYHPNKDTQLSWSNWDWSGLSKSTYHRNDREVQNFVRCVNPRAGHTQCALDYDSAHNVVKYRSNRAYLCRWSVRPDLVPAEHLLRTLGVMSDSDLFQIGGCMLRLAMSPTEKLWDAIDESLHHDAELTGRKEIQNFATAAQIGIHFRCGDSSFQLSPDKPINPECVYNPSVPWKGTNFYDDHSMDSPVDSAKCARKLAEGLASKLSSANSDNNRVLMFIASDYPPSSQQINQTVNWPLAITPPQGCHVDLQSSDKCTLQTSVHWMLLALSDHIVMQSMEVGEAHHKSPYSDTVKEGASLESPPISAFSRFAALYSLSPNVITFGSHCDPVNQAKLSHQTQGNWVCNPKMFF